MGKYTYAHADRIVNIIINSDENVKADFTSLNYTENRNVFGIFL